MRASSPGLSKRPANVADSDGRNAAKHAGDGASLTVTLGRANGRLTFVVADDGAGYDTEALGVSHGLQNMKDRIGALGGELTIESTPGAGTTVSGSVPVTVG